MVGNPYAIEGEIALIILLVNGTLGAMPNDFAKQKGLGSLNFPIQVKKIITNRNKVLKMSTLTQTE